MKFKIGYIVYLIICVLYPTLPIIGEISLRHLYSLIMFVACILLDGVKIDKFVKWYLAFLFFLGISSFVTGYAESFLRSLFGTYFAALVLYWSSTIMIHKYQAGYWIIISTIIIAIISAIVAYGQFFGNPIAFAIPQILRIDLGETLSDYYQKYDDFHGRYVSGLFDIVSAGYFFSAASVFALYNKNGKIKIINYVFFIIIIFALFLVQERSGLAIGITFALLYLFLSFKRVPSIILSTAIGAVIVLLLWGEIIEGTIDVNSMRYFEKISQTSRMDLFANSLDFFAKHPLGAIYQWIEEGHEQAHNVLSNSFLYGGLFGGIIILWIIIMQMCICARILYMHIVQNRYSSILVIFCMAYFDYTFNSFFHNPSIVGGTPFYFVLWGAVSSIYNVENKKISIKRRRQ